MNAVRLVFGTLTLALGMGLPHGSFSYTQEPRRAVTATVVKCPGTCRFHHGAKAPGAILLFVPVDRRYLHVRG
jgi:hypothetical protein